MRSKRDQASELAEKLLAVLEAQRGLGKESYPLTLDRLIELTDPKAPSELVKKGIGKKPFKDSATLASKTQSSGLVALAQDIEQLVGSPQLLESALEALCTPANPLWPLAKVAGAIENSKLRKPFAAAVLRQIQDNALPPSVGCRLDKKKPLLYLLRIPPPPLPPPPKKPEELLAQKLLAALEAQRRLGGEAYPVPLRQLIEQTTPAARPALVKKALAQPALQGKLALVDAKNFDAPLALAADRAQLISSDLLLEFLLRTKRKSTEQAFPVEGLLAKKSDLYQLFLEAVHRRIDANLLPPALGWMWIGKKKQVFFLENVHRGHGREERDVAPTPAPATPARGAPMDFGQSFDEAFSQLDRHKGGHNFVSLVDLRQRLAVARDVFDNELRKLRIAGRYTLSAAEGRHGMLPEERDAGIVENGTLLLYASRRTPCASPESGGRSPVS